MIANTDTVTFPVELTVDDLATMYGALATEHNRLLAEKKNPKCKASGQILERQYTRCLGTLAKVQMAIEAMYSN